MVKAKPQIATLLIRKQAENSHPKLVDERAKGLRVRLYEEIFQLQIK